MEPRQRVGIAAAGIALVLFITMLTPWWTVSVSGDFPARDESSGPFDDDLITSGQATIAGLLVLFAFLGAAAAAVLRFLRNDKDRIADVTLLGAGAMALLVVILAATTWPSGEMGFWDKTSSSSNGDFFGMTFNVQASTYANFGWYAGLLATLGAIAVGLWGMKTQPAAVGAPAATNAAAVGTSGTPGPAAATSPPPAEMAAASATVTAPAAAAAPAADTGKCQGVTQRGTPCSRNATKGAYCATHA